MPTKVYGVITQLDEPLTLSALLDKATGDEFAQILNFEINKATSGDAYGLRINITDTSSPGSIIPFSISDNSLIVKDGVVVVGDTDITTGIVTGAKFIVRGDATGASIAQFSRSGETVISIKGTGAAANSAYFQLLGSTDIGWAIGKDPGGAGDNRFAIRKSGVDFFVITQAGTSFGFKTVDFGSGEGVLGIKNADITPTTIPTGGGVLYIDAGALKYIGSGGTTTTIALA